MKNKGFYLSLEALTSIALLALLISMPLQEKETGLEDLQLFKKENDLLIIWAKRFDWIGEEQIRQELEFAFPGKEAIIIIDGTVVLSGKASGKVWPQKHYFLTGN